MLLFAFAGAVPRAADAAAPDTSGAAESRQAIRVLLLSPFAADWRARAWGQLSDLPVVLHSEPESARSAEPAQQTLARLARARAADVVAWLATDISSAPGPAHIDPGTRVLIYDTREQRLHERSVGAAWSGLDAGDRSAALEVAALTLRSVLRARLVEAPRVSPGPEPAREWGLRVAAGVTWQVDSQTRFGALSLGGELGVAGQRWSVALGGQWGLEADIPAHEATLGVARHALFLEARYHPLQLGTIDVGALVRGGLALLRRTTSPESDLALPLPDSELTSASFGIGAVGRWRPARQHALELVVAASGYTAPPRYTVSNVETGDTYEYALWQFQPSTSVAWAVTF